MSKELRTLCCGNKDIDDVVFEKECPTCLCYCLKCRKESILVTKEDYETFGRKK